MQITAKDVTGGAVAPTTETPEIQATETKIPTPPEQTPEQRAHFANMARKEKILRARAREIETEKQAIAAQRAEYDSLKTEMASIKAWKDQLVQQPLSVLAEAGVTTDQLTQMMLNGPDITAQEVKLLKAKIQSLEEKQNKALQTIEEGQKSSYTQALKQITNDVKLLVQGSDDYETIKNMNAENTVVALIEETFKSNGVLMSVEEAATEIEEYLVEEAIKLAGLKKIQGKINLPPQEVAVAKPAQPAPKTLSHTIQQTTKPLTNSERRARAIAAFQGKLSG
jgi:hypothetical protein